MLALSTSLDNGLKSLRARAGLSTRFGFLAGLLGLGVVRAQTANTACIAIEPDGSVGHEIPCGDPIRWRDGKAKNNQCPVCGTMAIPYKRNPPCGTYYDKGVLHSYNQGVYCGPEYTAKTEASNLVRCKRCNAAFWQDAE